MPELPILRDLVAVLTVSLVVVFALRRVRVPTVAALLLAGVLLGPGGLGLVRDRQSLETVAEVGVALLLFTIGLKLSLRELLSLRGLVFGAGGLQVALSVAGGAAVALPGGFPAGQAIFFGCLLAMSSTAIVLRVLEERGETAAPHGRFGLSVLVFQDLAVVPMMLALPLLGGAAGASWERAALNVLGSLAMVVGIVVCARVIFPRLLGLVVRARSRELFTLATLLVVLGTAWLGSRAGVSLALGAFLAGLVVADSDYAQQMLAEMVPLRDAFGSLFFVSVGMLLDPSLWWREPLATAGLGVAVVLGKAVIVGAVALAFGLGPRVAVLAGLGLAQIGEFSFILARAGAAHGLIGGETYQRFLAVSVLTMVATPFAALLAARLAPGADRIGWLRALAPGGGGAIRPGDAPAGEGLAALRDHVVVIGYGVNGRNVARVLRRLEVPCVVLELNPVGVRTARAAGETALYGDATSRDVLARAGLAHARVLVVAIADAPSSRQVVAVARAAAPGLKILVRTRYLGEVEPLYRLGADEVVPEEFETSLELAGAAMAAYGAPTRIIEREKGRIRAERYDLLSAEGRVMRPQAPLASLLGAADLSEVTVASGGPADGATLRALDLRGRAGASVVAIEREGAVTGNPAADHRLGAGDVIYLWGQPEQIAAARALLAP
ncbi:MAG: cation:proton antiporter domain-containing protein [Candidatus Krumholzibacteriia bacterium]